jgi:hypothetical protein
MLLASVLKIIADTKEQDYLSKLEEYLVDYDYGKSEISRLMDEVRTNEVGVYSDDNCSDNLRNTLADLRHTSHDMKFVKSPVSCNNLSKKAAEFLLRFLAYGTHVE